MKNKIKIINNLTRETELLESLDWNDVWIVHLLFSDKFSDPEKISFILVTFRIFQFDKS